MLWARFVEKNRREIEERTEQLKSIGNIAALVAGFAVVAFLEFQAEWSVVPQAVEAMFGFTTALTVRLDSFGKVSVIVACSGAAQVPQSCFSSQ